MDAARATRYKEKLELMEKRYSEISEWLKDEANEKTRLAIFKAFQELSEAAIDICAMIVKDEGAFPKDDYSNITFLKEKNIAGGKTAAILRDSNGLRNVLIHRYNTVDEETAFSSIKKISPEFKSFEKEVKSWLKKRL